MFAESLELIKGRKQFHTALHLRFDKFHHNKQITLKKTEAFGIKAFGIKAIQSVFLGLAHISVLSHGFQIIF